MKIEIDNKKIDLISTIVLASLIDLILLVLMIRNIVITRGDLSAGGTLLIVVLVALFIVVTVYAINRVLGILQKNKKAPEIAVQEPVDDDVQEPVIIDNTPTFVQNQAVIITAPEAEEVKEEVVQVQDLREYAEMLSSEREVRTTDDYTLDLLKTDFIAYAGRNGIIVTEKLVRDLISALGASRILSFRGNVDKIKILCKVIAGFFGNNFLFDKELKNYQAHSDLVYNKQARGETNFCCGLYTAIHRQNQLYPVGLFNVDSVKLDRYFKKLQPYVRSPFISYNLSIGDAFKFEDLEYVQKGNIALPKNLWFFIVPGGDKYTQLPFTFAKYANCVDVLDTDVELKNQSAGYFVGVKDGNVISFDAFVNVVQTAQESKELSLEGYKKIDKLENYVASLIEFAIGNRTSRLIERYTSLYLALGGDETSALDSIIAYTILPIFANYPRLKNTSNERSLAEFITELFGAGNAPRSQKMLEVLGLY